MRNAFEKQLSELHTKLIEMGSFCEEAIKLSSQALAIDTITLGNVSLLKAKIEQMEREIESLCLKLLLLQQPVAGDLRQISAALKMITDMERIGDQADDIAEIIGYLIHRNERDCSLIVEMAGFTITMVSESIDAFIKQDTVLAQKVIDDDDKVDEAFLKVKQALIAMIAKNPDNGGYALDLLMIAKHYERIGDNAVNIASWVVFSVTGVHKGETEL